jgi:hypothetical protein
MGSRPSFLRPARIVQHVFAEVALLPVGARNRIAALGITIPAAVDIFGRSRRDLAALAAVGVVVLGKARASRRLAAMRAGAKRERCQHEDERCGLTSHV